MNNVTIETKDVKDQERKIKLSNGSLVVLKSLETYKVIGVYLVVSFRNVAYPKTAKWCILVNLDNGSNLFEEPCSRDTTEKRVLKHIIQAIFGGNDTKDFSIDVHKKDTYKIKLSLNNNEEV